MVVSYKPAGYHTVTPYIVVNDAIRMIEFTKKAFAASEIERMMRPDGTMGHPERFVARSPVHY